MLNNRLSRHLESRDTQEGCKSKIFYLHLRFFVYTPKASFLYLMILCIKFGGYWPSLGGWVLNSMTNFWHNLKKFRVGCQELEII